MKNKYRIVIPIVVLLILFYYLYTFIEFKKRAGPSGIGTIDQNYTYISKENNYSVLIPVAWNVHKIFEAPESLPYLSETMGTSNPKAFINVSRANNIFLSIPELKTYLENYKKGLDHLSEISDEQLIIGKNEGFLYEYTFFGHLKIGDFQYHCYDWIVPKNGGYVFVFCVDNAIWEQGNPIFLSMIDSIEIQN